MDQTKTNKEVETAQQALKDFGAQWMNYFSCVQQMIEENGQLRQRMAEKDAKIAKLEEALEQQKKDNEWSSRVTYEGVVEQIAACEDAKERDEARKLIEPLLKRNQAAQFRKDIKKRVKELNEDGGIVSNFNNYGTYNEIQPGGININNE